MAGGEFRCDGYTVLLPTAHNTKRWHSQTGCENAGVQALNLSLGFGDFVIIKNKIKRWEK
ncbi:MAG: hypothetical protein U9Q68_04465 [Euryarchaeota archaeon]|nr:hypothetical protein [Euryarchaeota archaeon]